MTVFFTEREKVLEDKLEVLKREMKTQEEKVEAMKKKFEEAETAYNGLDDEEAEKPSNRRNKSIVEKYHRAKKELNLAIEGVDDIQTQIHLAVEELKRLGTPRSLTIEPRYSPFSSLFH